MAENRTIAYFSMEVALASAVPTYSGGLGVLAGDTLRAAADLGLPYAWGGGGTHGPGPGLPPDAGVVGFDCSGLTQYAYAQAGIPIPRNSRAQYSALPKVSRGALQAGDLVFWASDPSNWQTIHHVAIYLGDGRVVQAPESGDVVKISTMWWGGYAGAVRPSACCLATAAAVSQARKLLVPMARTRPRATRSSSARSVSSRGVVRSGRCSW